MKETIEALLTVNDVAKLISCSPSWVYKACERGEIPCVRVGGMVRFVPAAIRAYLEAAGTPAGAES